MACRGVTSRRSSSWICPTQLSTRLAPFGLDYRALLMRTLLIRHRSVLSHKPLGSQNILLIGCPEENMFTSASALAECQLPVTDIQMAVNVKRKTGGRQAHPFVTHV